MSAQQVYKVQGSSGISEKVCHAFLDRLAEALAEEMFKRFDPELFKEMAECFADELDGQLKDMILNAKEGKDNE